MSTQEIYAINDKRNIRIPTDRLHPINDAIVAKNNTTLYTLYYKLISDLKTTDEKIFDALMICDNKFHELLQFINNRLIENHKDLLKEYICIELIKKRKRTPSACRNGGCTWCEYIHHTCSKPKKPLGELPIWWARIDTESISISSAVREAWSTKTDNAYEYGCCSKECLDELYAYIDGRDLVCEYEFCKSHITPIDFTIGWRSLCCYNMPSNGMYCSEICEHEKQKYESCPFCHGTDNHCFNCCR